MTRTPMTLPLPQRVKRFDTQRGADQWARAFDYARAFNRLPALGVEQDTADGAWWAVNPDARAPALPGGQNRPKPQ